ATLEHWSLLAYVTALTAAAQGHPYGLTRSLVGTTLGDELAAQGKLLTLPDPGRPGRHLGLVTALRPDVVFMHTGAGDPTGPAVSSPPHCEGFAAAFAARLGVIVTVERLLDVAATAEVPHLLPVPPQRVLAICEEPFGAHPQPCYFAPREPSVPSY